MALPSIDLTDREVSILRDYAHDYERDRAYDAKGVPALARDLGYRSENGRALQLVFANNRIGRDYARVLVLHLRDEAPEAFGRLNEAACHERSDLCAFINWVLVNAARAEATGTDEPPATGEGAAVVGMAA